MGSGPPAVERSRADAAPPSMPDMNGEPTHGPTDKSDPGTDPATDPGPAPDNGSDTGSDTGSDAASETRSDTGTAGHRLTAALTIGSRVVVRYRLQEGAEAGA